MTKPIIEYHDVYKRFDAPVLEGVSLRVYTGEILAIVGPSGTGKSVLLKTTIGLIMPDRGDVFVDGQSVTRAGTRALREIRNKAGYVFQNAALFDSLNVFENVAMGLPEATQRTLGPAEVARRVRESIEQVNLDPEHVLTKLPAELSGGMRKRVGLARSIVGRPCILLYDEPVTGLDPVNAAAVSRLIVEIGRASCVTSLVVTHDVEGALAICDRIVLLADGKLRFVGTPAEFSASGIELVKAFAHRAAANAAAVELVERNREHA
jgi:phospholipid/cholesterol/gamma-HCH transport system ATP-binding protein